MQPTSAIRHLGIAASITGILEGLAWAAMSLAAIVLYNWEPDVDTPTTYGQLLEFLLYNHFLLGSGTSIQPDVHFIIRPFDFTIFMWIYFLLSVGWFAVSVDQASAIRHNHKRQTTIMVLWAIVTIIISLIDLIFVCLLARDYAACSYDDTAITEGQYYCYLTIGIVMSIAARGYILWLLNLIFSIIIIYASIKVYKENDKYGLMYIPRVTIPKSNNSNLMEFPKSNTTNFGMPKTENVQPYIADGEPSPPSFLSRGDKFTY